MYVSFFVNVSEMPICNHWFVPKWVSSNLQVSELWESCLVESHLFLCNSDSKFLCYIVQVGNCLQLLLHGWNHSRHLLHTIQEMHEALHISWGAE